MKNKRRVPADPSQQVDLLSSSAVCPHGDELSSVQPDVSADGCDSLRRVSTEEEHSLRRKSLRARRPGLYGTTLRSRSGAITGRSNRVRNGQPAQQDSRRHSRHKGLKIALIVILVLILAVVISFYLVWQSLISKVNIVNPTDETLASEFNVPTESLANPIPVEKGIQNILLMGVDSRDVDSTQTNSDSMMILTIDETNDTIKLTSLQRDMLVYMPGKTDPVKLNAVNTHGGPALTMRVVNDTLRLSIANYVIVDMYGMEVLIDLAGGIEINVEKDQLYYINEMVGYQNFIFPDTPPSRLLTKSGMQLLNGRQSVAYARIRKGDSDYQRMGRQRIVIQALLNRFMAANLGTKTNMISKGLPYITTNLSKTQMTSLGLTTVPLMKGKIEQMQLPITGYFVEDPDPVWVNRCDFNGMIPLLQQFIFGRTYPFDPVKKIPGAPNSGLSIPTTRSTTTKATTKATSVKPTSHATTSMTFGTTTATTDKKPTTTTATTTATTAATTAAAAA